jgi:hypothetical protein
LWTTDDRTFETEPRAANRRLKGGCSFVEITRGNCTTLAR